ncbi:MAG TPA: hypothetical protein VGB79_09530 [Allosphingosinicella sp.]|jgi:hypothetical protein
MSHDQPFTSLVRSTEASLLRRIHARIESGGVSSRGQFGDLMAAAFEDGRLSPRDLARDFGYSLSAVYRWIDGSTAPHRSQWPLVAQWVMERLAIKAGQLECEEEVEA